MVVRCIIVAIEIKQNRSVSHDSQIFSLQFHSYCINCIDSVQLDRKIKMNINFEC